MKFLVSILLALAFTMSIYAEDVVYLRNGNVYRGTIIEEVEGEYLRIRLNDGGVFACEYDQIDRIAEEEKQANNFVRKPKTIESGTKLYKSLPSKGYRGFVDVGYTFATGDWGLYRYGFSTSHGYQVCPYFFAGVGAGMYVYQRYNSNNNWHNSVHTVGQGDPMSIPIFAHLRSEFVDSWITPYVDAKVGYSIFDKAGFYSTISAGARVALKISGRKVAFSLGAGYDMQHISKVRTQGKYFGEYLRFGDVFTNGVQIRFGVDF